MGFMIRSSKLPDKNGNPQTCCQCPREFESVMRVELEFRQQIGAGNTKKCAGAESQCPAQDHRACDGKITCTNKEQHRPQRSYQSEQDIEQVAGKSGTAARSHQR